MKATISVIIPVYNAAQTVQQALAAVLKQDNFFFEVIIINDGSKDDSLLVVNNFIKQNQQANIIYKIIDQPNGGVSVARNAGLKAATGNFIAFLDADDEWLPKKTKLQMDVLEQRPDIDYLGGKISAAPLKNNFLKKFTQPLTHILLTDLVFKNYFQPSTVIFRATVLHTVGYFREDQRYAEEGNYFMRIAHRFNCYLLDEQVIVYGQGKAGFGASGLSANIDEMERGELMNLSVARKNNYINFAQYFVAVCFSLIKYARRKIVSSGRHN